MVGTVASERPSLLLGYPWPHCLAESRKLPDDRNLLNEVFWTGDRDKLESDPSSKAGVLISDASQEFHLGGKALV